MLISNCKELPQDDFCYTMVSSTHYAIGTLEINANPSDLNDEISQINELMEFTTCGELLNTLNCVIRYPACSTDTENIIPICDTQCLQIDVHIKQCLLDLQNSNLFISNFPLVESLLTSVECEEPQTYYDFWRQYVDSNSSNCVLLST